MSDRLGVMHDGSLLQVGTPEDIYEHPRSRFVADFIGEINLLDGTVGSDGTVVLKGGYVLPLDHQIGAGAAVNVALRPEQLHLVLADDSDLIPPNASRLVGTVGRRVYFGESYYYEVTSEAGALDVRQENRPGLTLFEPGQRVAVHWDPSAAAMLEE